MKDEKQNKIYKIPVQFVFDGEFTIRAESRVQAEEYVKNHCGLCLGGNIHSTLPDEDVNWNFSLHSEKRIRRRRKSQK